MIVNDETLGYYQVQQVKDYKVWIRVAGALLLLLLIIIIVVLGLIPLYLGSSCNYNFI